MLNQSRHHDFFIDNVMINPKEAQDLEKRTVLQGESDEWLQQHKYRLTASNFRRVYFSKTETFRFNVKKYIYT